MIDLKTLDVLQVALLLCLTVTAMTVTCPIAQAQPRTMYKPHDIENARQNLERYEWAQAIVRAWEGRVQYAMEQDREFFEELIPELTPGNNSGQYCPVCINPVTRTGGNLTWSVTEPNSLVCSRCGTVYPNEEYPETGVLEARRMGQTFTYYQTPEERALGPDATAKERAEHAFWWLGNRPQATSFSGLIRWRRVQWAIGQTLPLAKLYTLTGDIAYAERVAWILDRMARVYPNYLWHCYDGSIADLPTAQVAASMGDPTTPAGGRFPPETILHAYGLNQNSDDAGEYATLYNGFWGSARLNVHARDPVEQLLPMVVAYDLIRDARYPDGTALMDEQVQQRIVEDIFDASSEEWEHWRDLSNKGVTVRTLSAAVGALLEQPERVRWALDGFNEMLATRYHFDGFYAESPSYASYNYANIGALPNILHSYSDPAGYQPEDGERLENLNLFAEGHHYLALQAMMRMMAPGHYYPSIGDTPYGTKAGANFAETLAARVGSPYTALLESLTGKPLADWGTEYSLWYRSPDLRSEGEAQLPLHSEWFPGWHVGVLRLDSGGGDTDTALFLTGDEHRLTLRTGHRHSDILGLIVYALGREMITDRGYFSGSSERTPDGLPGQTWTASTLSHNLVVVDEKNQSGTPRGSNLELFGVADGVEVMQVSAINAYPQCDEYRRTCALMTALTGEPYVVDLFRVRGGEIHQYSFHCTGTMEAIAPDEPAPRPVELSDAWSRWLQKPLAVTPEQPCIFTWTDEDVHLDLLLLNSSDTVEQIVVADAPGWRRADRTGDFDKPSIQQILAENRAGQNGEALATQYAAVMVPYTTEASPVLSAQLLENDYESGAMALEVRFADRTDYIISARDGEQRQYGPISLAGQFAFISVDGAGRVTQAYLLAGTHLQHGETVLQLPQATSTLQVASVSDRTFTLAAPLPAELTESAKYVLCAGLPALEEGNPSPRTGFEIKTTGTNSITVRDYPVFDCDEVTILHSKSLNVHE